MPANLARSLRVVPVAAISAAVLTLSGCGAGMHPATLDDQPLDARSASAGPIEVRGAIIVAPEGDDSGELLATIFNTGDEADALDSVTFKTISGDARATLKPSSIALPPGRSTTIPDGARPIATISSGLEVGTYVTAQFSFANAGTVNMTLFVVAAQGSYATYGTPPTV